MNGSRKWSIKYKKSINCRRPKGFSQRQYCKYGKTRKQKQKIGGNPDRNNNMSKGAVFHKIVIKR